MGEWRPTALESDEAARICRSMDHRNQVSHKLTEEMHGGAADGAGAIAASGGGRTVPESDRATAGAGAATNGAKKEEDVEYKVKE